MGVYKIYCGDLCLPQDGEPLINFYAVVIKNSKGKVVYQNVQQNNDKDITPYLLSEQAFKDALLYIEKNKINNFKFKIFVKNNKLFKEIKTDADGLYAKYKDYIHLLHKDYYYILYNRIIDHMKHELEKNCLLRIPLMNKVVKINTNGIVNVGDAQVDLQDMSCSCFYYYFFNKLLNTTNTDIKIKCKHILYIEDLITNKIGLNFTSQQKGIIDNIEENENNTVATISNN